MGLRVRNQRGLPLATPRAALKGAVVEIANGSEYPQSGPHLAAAMAFGSVFDRIPQIVVKAKGPCPEQALTLAEPQ